MGRQRPHAQFRDPLARRRETISRPWNWVILGHGGTVRRRHVSARQWSDDSSIPLQTLAGTISGRGRCSPAPASRASGGLHRSAFRLLWNPGRGATKRSIEQIPDPSLEMGVQTSPAASTRVRSCASPASRRQRRVRRCGGESVSDDIIFPSRTGATVRQHADNGSCRPGDVAIEEGCQSGWVRGSAPNPGLDLFRIRPHEYTPGAVLRLTRELAAFERASDLTTISWDQRQRRRQVDLYYDTDNANFDGTLIKANVPTASFGRTPGTRRGGAPSVYSTPSSAKLLWRWEREPDSEVAPHSEQHAAPEVSTNRARINFGLLPTAPPSPARPCGSM